MEGLRIDGRCVLTLARRVARFMWRRLGTALVLIGSTGTSFQVLAAAQPDPAVRVDTVEFWFRFLLSISVSVAGWVLVRHHNRLDKLSSANLINRTGMTEHELKQIQQQLYLLREAIGKEYHTKDEISKHFEEMKHSLTALHRRLDGFQERFYSNIRRD